ncbi:hypothetical protein SAMN05421542_1577 [Chryseobacterium jejuense]|uniref:Uncharacterized protein n=1 Tax=Chryseobacterium jejuense TaxID=445960 RepID=A0A2X2X376_CHRJE|nr:hypothetical protein SAMN05421542_1577 [Chryseobacterium jejuense]SQB47308.1 Uncharacterised protein [Chryseobacterium jejuense]
MGLNFFQIAVLLILIGVIIVFWKKLQIVSTFLLGGLLLMGLCSLDFLGFQGTSSALIGFILAVAYCMINITYLILYIKKDHRISLIYAIAFFTLFTLFCLFYIDSGKYYELKFGIIVRLFLSFFPLYFFKYYKTNKE